MTRNGRAYATSDVRKANRPDGTSKMPLWNGSFRKLIAFGPDETQNGELPARRGRISGTAKTYRGIPA
jgi:hypothetical protein